MHGSRCHQNLSRFSFFIQYFLFHSFYYLLSHSITPSIFNSTYSSSHHRHIMMHMHYSCDRRKPIVRTANVPLRFVQLQHCHLLGLPFFFSELNYAPSFQFWRVAIKLEKSIYRMPEPFACSQFIFPISHQWIVQTYLKLSLHTFHCCAVWIFANKTKPIVTLN